MKQVKFVIHIGIWNFIPETFTGFSEVGNESRAYTGYKWLCFNLQLYKK